MLTKIEKKIVAKYPVARVKVQDCGCGGFILSDGSIVRSADHATLCKTIGQGLSAVIRSGICRYMFRSGNEGKIAAFEFVDKKLTREQTVTINLLLRADDFYTVITAKTIISKFRPIRSIQY